MVENWAHDQKIAHPWFDSQTGIVSLEKELYAYFPLWPSSLPVVVAQPNERIAKQNRKKGAMRWCGWTNADNLVHTNEIVR